MRRLPYLLTSVAILSADLYSKYAVFAWLDAHDRGAGRVHWLFGEWFGIVRVYNPGVTGGLGAGIPPILLTLFTSAAILAIAACLLVPKIQSRWVSLGLAFVLGGATGNLYDRIVYREVRDFIDVWPRLFDSGWLHHWPTFNIADSAILTGVCLLVFHSLFLAKREAAAAAAADEVGRPA